MLNFSKSSPVFSLPESISHSGKSLLISNYPVDPAQEIRQLALRPYEARVYRLEA
jgi:oligo-1,6-glucosidase